MTDIKNQIFFEDSINLNFPEVENSLQMLVDLVETYKMSPPEVLNFDEQQGYEYALENDAVFIRGWPGLLNQQYTILEYGPKLKFIKKAPLPHLAGSTPSLLYGGWNFMISKYSSKKEEALTLYSFCFTGRKSKTSF